MEKRRGEESNLDISCLSRDTLRAIISKVCSCSGGFRDGNMTIHASGFVQQGAGSSRSQGWNHEALAVLAAFWVQSNYDCLHIADIICFSFRPALVRKASELGKRPVVEEVIYAAIRLVAARQRDIYRMTASQGNERPNQNKQTSSHTRSYPRHPQAMQRLATTSSLTIWGATGGTEVRLYKPPIFPSWIRSNTTHAACTWKLLHRGHALPKRIPIANWSFNFCLICFKVSWSAIIRNIASRQAKWRSMKMSILNISKQGRCWMYHVAPSRMTQTDRLICFRLAKTTKQFCQATLALLASLVDSVG